MIQKVDTFSHDIADEIKRKDASLSDITAASHDVGNMDSEILAPRKPLFLYGVIFFFVLTVITGIGAYIYFYQYLFPKQEKEAQVATALVVKKTADITTISPKLALAIGNFVTTITKQEKGYTLMISNYPAVFAYMTRNEQDYIEELLQKISPQSTTTPLVPKVVPVIVIATTTPKTSETATTSSSTAVVSKKKTTGTTTVAVSTTTQEEPVIATSTPFTDITIDNQNMRVFTVEGRTVVYAFVADRALLISNSPDGILALKGAILR